MAGNSYIPFAPQGPTVTFTANTAAPATVEPTYKTGETPSGEYLVVNTGTVPVVIGYDAVSATARANANNLVGNTFVVNAGEQFVVRCGTANKFSGKSASAAVVYITPGTGMV